MYLTFCGPAQSHHCSCHSGESSRNWLSRSSGLFLCFFKIFNGAETVGVLNFNTERSLSIFLIMWLFWRFIGYNCNLFINLYFWASIWLQMAFFHFHVGIFGLFSFFLQVIFLCFNDFICIDFQVLTSLLHCINCIQQIIGEYNILFQYISFQF